MLTLLNTIGKGAGRKKPSHAQQVLKITILNVNKREGTSCKSLQGSENSSEPKPELTQVHSQNSHESLGTLAVCSSKVAQIFRVRTLCSPEPEGFSDSEVPRSAARAASSPASLT